jgi:hypothetical protein
MICRTERLPQLICNFCRPTSCAVPSAPGLLSAAAPVDAEVLVLRGSRKGAKQLTKDATWKRGCQPPARPAPLCISKTGRIGTWRTAQGSKIKGNVTGCRTGQRGKMQITLILAAIFNIIGGLRILFLQRFIAPLIHLDQVAREKRAAVSRGGCHATHLLLSI